MVLDADGQHAYQADVGYEDSRKPEADPDEVGVFSARVVRFWGSPVFNVDERLKRVIDRRSPILDLLSFA